jgi:DmsE family decaheme c-type cytochrome
MDTRSQANGIILSAFGLMSLIAGIFLAGTASAATGDNSPVSEALNADKACTVCHDANSAKPILSIYQSRHGVKADARTPRCQSCHGTSSKHQSDPTQTPDVVFGTKEKHTDPKIQADTCLSCHKTGLRMHWSGSQHERRDVACASCHTAHASKDPVLVRTSQPEVCFSCHKEQRAQERRISHHPIKEGKVICSDCHNPHGSTGPKLLTKDSVNETCYLCHAEKRGPFLWEHAPVVDNCTTCHTPHGSSTAPLLKTRVPWLCQDCHTGDHGAQLNSGANLQAGNLTTINGAHPLGSASARIQVNARACINCHVLVHGSNHPAGAKFQR